MVFHVGIDPFWGNVSVYNDATLETTSFIIEKVLYNDIDKVDAMFEEITAKINGDIGCACIYLQQHYNNEIRKKLVQAGKQAGLYKIQIIDLLTLQYFQSISQAGYKPSDGNYIWIITSKFCFVWEILVSKAIMIKIFNIFGTVTKEDLIEINKKFFIDPSLIIYDENCELDASIVNNLFPRCKLFASEKLWGGAKSALIKARILAKDPEVLKFNADTVLHNFMLVKINGKMISKLTVDEYQALPLEKTAVIAIEKDAKVLKISVEDIHYSCFQITEPMEKSGKCQIKFKIDSDGIYSLECIPVKTSVLQISNDHDSDSKTDSESENDIDLTNADPNTFEINLDQNNSDKEIVHPPNTYVNAQGKQIEGNQRTSKTLTFPQRGETSILPSSSVVTTRFESPAKIKEEKACNMEISYPIDCIINKTKSVNDSVSAIGINFGTSRCSAAVNSLKGFETIPIDNTGKRYLASYISFKNENGKYGEIVAKQLQQSAKSTVFDIKRIIGRSYEDIKIDKLWPFDVVNLDNKPTVLVHSQSDLAERYAEEIVALILMYIKQKAEEFRGKELTEVVIAVPSIFSDTQLEAMNLAGVLALFETVYLLPAPVAASIAFLADRAIYKPHKMLVFDFGGGTLDIGIFNYVNGVLEVKSHVGDINLGGSEFDKILFNHFSFILENKYDIDANSNDKSKYRLLQKSQETKHILSVEEEAKFDINDFNTNINESLTITRQMFESMSVEILMKIKKLLNEALSSSYYSSEDINEIVLCGGSSRLPMVIQLLLKTFPKAAHFYEEIPNELVAIGAAQYASYLHQL